MPIIIVLLITLCLAITGCRSDIAKDNTENIFECSNNGWQHELLKINNLQRNYFWRAPQDTWSMGAIIVLHGGSGNASQWCNANRRFLRPQVKFTENAIEQGFAVFSLDSSNIITDRKGRVCGKVWNDEVRDRPNIDLPFIEYIITKIIPNKRPTKANTSIYITGLSSGGFMTVRASTHFNDLVTAFASVASGDPYGWHRQCVEGSTKRKTVHGAGYDNETLKQITEINACVSQTYPNEKQWEGATIKDKPHFLAIHHKHDGIVDFSCHLKLVKQLYSNGYSGEVLHLENNKKRSIRNHLWLDEYNQPILDFFTSEREYP